MERYALEILSQIGGAIWSVVRDGHGAQLARGAQLQLQLVKILGRGMPGAARKTSGQGNAGQPPPDPACCCRPALDRVQPRPSAPASIAAPRETLHVHWNSLNATIQEPPEIA
jgi:hypothetical protein